MKADILSRKDQVNTKENNKDVQLLKEELWTRRMTVEVMMLKRMTTADDLEIMKEIKRNNTKEQEVVQVLEKNCYDQCLLETTWTWAKGMMMIIGCAEVVSVSTLCSRCHNLISFFLLPHAV